jgi:hypothetical protein
MGLSSGTRLGTYEVRALIGAGGMGEVYEAHDSKLGRGVAIKVLPEQFARDSERLARFQREAKLLASLNHPNIATIHGLEQSDGTHYLVMELAAPARAYRNPRVSPDGQRVAVTIEESESHNWLYDLRRDTLTRLTFEGSTHLMGAWTPDSKRIAFQSNRAGPQNLFWQPADGSGAAERLTTTEYLSTPNSWTPDGQSLAFIEVRPETGSDINVLTLSGPSASSGQAPSAGSGQGHKVQPFLRTRFTEGAPGFSPDGRWMVYISDESGRREVYVQPYPGPGGKWQISTEGGTEPVWNRNGRELFYRIDDRMMAVDITTQPTFSAGSPRMLFEAPYLPSPATFPNYDVSPDGQRFLMLKPGEAAQAATQINVVLNWSEELKRRVPTGK